MTHSLSARTLPRRVTVPPIAGANFYVAKPVSYEGFSDAIRQLGLFFSVGRQ